MLVREIQKISGADELHDIYPNQVDRGQRRNDPECESAYEAVLERFFLLSLGQAEHHHRENNCVVGAEESLENDEDKDGEEVWPGEQVSLSYEIDESNVIRPTLGKRRTPLLWISRT